jgi:hypothetical protein
MREKTHPQDPRKLKVEVLLPHRLRTRNLRSVSVAALPHPAPHLLLRLCNLRRVFRTLELRHGFAERATFRRGG